MIPNQLIDKFKETIIEWLDKGEKPDYNYSRQCDGRWVILTNKRAIFAVEKDSSLCYLFDSKDLLNDWKENGSKLVRYKTEDVLIHVYLLIALRVEGKNFESIRSDFPVIEEKFLKLISALPEGKAIRIIHQFVNLLPFEGWAGDYYWKCINLGLPVLGAKIGAEDITSNLLKTLKFVNKDKTEKEKLRTYSYFHNYTFLMGDVCFMRDEYEEARKFFEILVKSDSEDELAQARYNWALGMEAWKKQHERTALECFEKAKEYFDKFDDKMHSKLMDFLKSSIYAMEDAKPYSSQLIFLEFGEVPESGETAEIEKQEQESKKFSEVISFIKKRFDALEETLTNKDKKELNVVDFSKKKPKEEKSEYEIWDIKGRRPAFENEVEDLRNKNKKGKLDIFVDEDGAVYFNGKKVKELKKTQILYDFLIYFLKNKGIGGTYENLFLEVWPLGREKKLNPHWEITEDQKNNVIRMKNRLNTLLKNYEAKEMNYEYNKYRLADDCTFYFIQKNIC